jgi:hypothetical protein
MHEELWAGVELKVENAEFFLDGMGKSLLPPERTQMNVALQSGGATIDTGWQRSFYAQLDAFLAMGRSVPEITQCCFGTDRSSVMKSWFDGLPLAERIRRQTFTDRFKSARDAFDALPLSTARNISLHRSGVAPVVVKITGRFGVSHMGTPIMRVPTAESRPIVAGDDPSTQWAATLPPVQVQPSWTDFSIDGRSLFPECQAYLKDAGNVLDQARIIAQVVHRNDALTAPPS